MFANKGTFLKKVARSGKKLLTVVLPLLVLCLTWTGVSIDSTRPANALTLDKMPMVVAESNPINEVFGAGTTDQIEGKAKKDIGTVQRNVGKVQGQVEGAAKQAKGRAEQDIGRVKNRADKAGSDLEDASENIVDAVKDFFGQ